jgi:hypothetical protein
MTRLKAICFVSAILLTQASQAATSRDDITSILDLTRVLTPYKQTDWKFCEPGTYVSSINISASKTPSSSDSKTMRSLDFTCTSPDDTRFSFITFFNVPGLPDYGIETDSDYESCPKNVFPNQNRSHVKSVFPGIGSFVRESYRYNSGYSGLEVSCDDTSENKLTLNVEKGGKIDWRGGYSCSDGAVCGATLFVGETTDDYDAAISGMSFACCKKPD